MLPSIIIGALLLIVAALLVCSVKPPGECFANGQLVNVDPNGQATFPTADAAFTSRYLIAKRGTSATSINICGAADVPLGIVEDETPSDSDLNYPLNVALLGAIKGTRRVIASAAISAGDFIVPAAGGKVRTLPTSAGTYYVIGQAFAAATADGDQLQIVPTFPTKTVVASS